ncbi:outer membrane protein assembly factor BamE [Diaphorobacter aerolatus]|uniref:Outer membrane protein assembly factor BamE n=1 Tax=Diaphorobacter aerolatus TaxID=1288495 RepID=A0A7H0GH14_9BURK|nr:outer membrane protein assembly factor BamE [Diaphorobacter aerolatus]QNP47580.1 outer membrane protein assembly factor BamE [Diaphorobacter aerolatus]
MALSMFAPARYGVRCGAIILLSAGLAACGSFDSASHRLASAITPYKIDVVQGNFISKEQVDALKPGMGRQQVKEILGTPLVMPLFHNDRWEYIFTLKRPGVEQQTRKLSVFFKDDVLERYEGDEMPTEAEFVSSLASKVPKSKVPNLEATDDQLKRLPAKPEPTAAENPANQPPLAPLPSSYPPLETRK